MCMLDKHYTTELHPSPVPGFLIERFCYRFIFDFPKTDLVIYFKNIFTNYNRNLCISRILMLQNYSGYFYFYKEIYLIVYMFLLGMLNLAL
jgi:hypothetical protein